MQRLMQNLFIPKNERLNKFRARQHAIKSESARQMRYRSVIRVSFFRFFDAQSGQTRRLAEVGPSPRLNSFIPALLFRRTTRHKRPLSLRLDLQFPVNESLAVERYTGVAPSRVASDSTSVTSTKRRVIDGAKAPETSDFREGNSFRECNYARRPSVRLSDSFPFLSLEHDELIFRS